MDRDRLQVTAGHLDQIGRAAKGIEGKGREARALGCAAAEPASDQIGQGRGEIVMRENGAGKRLAEDGIGIRPALRLAADPSASGAPFVCAGEYRRSGSRRQ